jgi:hypothetical protein
LRPSFNTSLVPSGHSKATGPMMSGIWLRRFKSWNHG